MFIHYTQYNTTLMRVLFYSAIATTYCMGGRDILLAGAGGDKLKRTHTNREAES